MNRPYQHLDVRVQTGVFCVRIKNHKLQETDLEQLGDELTSLIDNENCRKLVLSLAPDDFQCLYSLLLAKLMNLQRHMARVGGTMALAEVSEYTERVFRATGLYCHFKFYPDTPGAVAALA